MDRDNGMLMQSLYSFSYINSLLAYTVAAIIGYCAFVSIFTLRVLAVPVSKS